ncbi:MAG: sugar ABC transporter substrate-binding protein [Acetobacteraceae bacterium]|nr:sugar ABC transporter substrate-binding protein [Acetobacteraceae bacterium]
MSARPYLTRRAALGLAAALAAPALLRPPASAASANAASANADWGVDPEQWTLARIEAAAGTVQVDTAADCARLVPLDHRGALSFWYVGPTQASPAIDRTIQAEFFAAFRRTYPNIALTEQNLGYNEMLDKVRTAALGNAAPVVARFPIMWGVEFAAKGLLAPFGPQDAGFRREDFWPGALRSCMWQGGSYGVPTNNEVVGLIWNAAVFRDAGLDPETPPATWDELVAFARQITQRTGKSGYGVVARVNGGDTPFRFMPQAWAYGGGALDEADAHATYKQVLIDSPGTRAALQLSADMYLRDHSAPRSALTNTSQDNDSIFISGQLGMMGSHPSDYAAMLDRAHRATGADRATAAQVVADLRYGVLPRGPVRPAVVFGGSNVHVFTPEAAGGAYDRDAVRAFIAFMTGPEWSTKLAWSGSNPGHLTGFRTVWMRQRLDSIKFLGESTVQQPYGIPFPVVPQSSEIMNIIVPTMMQNALTGRMTVAEATADAAGKVREAMAG